MRPGEVCIMRGCNLETSGKVWLYRPEHHKTAHYGHERVIYIGSRGQEFLRPFLRHDLRAFIFSPADAEAERRAASEARRATPQGYGNGPGTNRKRSPKHRPGPRYNVAAYRRAIARACDAAFPPPTSLSQAKGETHEQWMARLTPEQRDELKRWRDAHRWHPHQLRHTAATKLRKQYGLEAARVVLGHRSAAVAEIYAEIDSGKAQQIMGEVG
jgi:integrase